MPQNFTWKNVVHESHLVFLMNRYKVITFAAISSLAVDITVYGQSNGEQKY